MKKHAGKALFRGILLALVIAPLAVMAAPDEVLKYWPDTAGEYSLPKAIVSFDKKAQSPEAALAEDDQSAKLPSGSDLLLDFGADTGGFFELKINVAKTAKIRITYSEALAFTKGQKDWLSSASSSYRKLMQRTYEVKQSGWFSDKVLMGGARYVRIEVVSGEIQLDAVRCKKTFLNCDPKAQGFFLSSDEELNKIWYAGYYTTCLDTIRSDQGGKSGKVKIGSGDWVIVDGAKRDRLIWSGDLAIADRVVYVSNGRYDIVKDSLKSLADWQNKKTGIYPACSRAELGARVADRFTEYSLWQVVNSYEYYLYSGDTAFIKQIYPGMLRALDYHDRQTDGQGLILQKFSKDGMNYSYSLIRTGAISYTNALYYLALTDAARIALDRDDIGQAQLFLTRADRIKNYFNTYFWDKRAGAFRNAKRDRDHRPLDGNAMAILSGLTDKGKASQILDFFNKSLKLSWGDRQFDKAYVFPRKLPFADGHNAKFVMPYINAFDAAARYQSGRDQEALDLIKRCWGAMAKQDPNFSDWEWIGPKGKPDKPTTSLAHAWSAGSSFLLSEWVIGVRPTEPGFAHYLVDPHPNGINWAQGAVPSPRGLLEVNWKDAPEKFEISLSLPAGTGPRVNMPGKGDSVKVMLNDTVIYDGKNKVDNPAVLAMDISADRIGVELREGGSCKLSVEKIAEVTQ